MRSGSRAHSGRLERKAGRRGESEPGSGTKVEVIEECIIEMDMLLKLLQRGP
jgi:hypothetical protein